MATGAQASGSRAAEPQSPAIGAVIAGKYRLDAELGRGGMGAVYAARHVVTGRWFAVKLLGGERLGDAAAKARFEREAMLASSIQHPAIVEVYDVGCDGSQPYMVMKLVEGETLSARIDRGPLPLEEAIAILLPVIDAIRAAHACGIVHRDLKPDNVMLEREGARVHPRVLDFGISKLASSEARPRITNPGVLLGTPTYMAPEQVRCEENLDGRTDIYALGVMLYEMLTGVLPFDDHDDAVLLRKIRKGGAPGVRVHRPDLPVALEAVIARAIARSRELRYQSAAELVRDLTPFASPRPSAPAKAPQAAAREASSLTPLESEVTLRVARAGSVQLYAALCVVGLALAVALAWVPWRSPHPQAGASAAPAAGARPAEPALGIGRMAPLPEARRVPAPAKLAAVALDPVLPSEAQPDARARPASEDRAADARRSRRAARRAAKRHALAEPAPPAQSSSLPAIGSELLDPFD